MKYKPGDEVFIKAEITGVSDCSERPYFVAPDCRSINWVSEDKIIPMDKTYEQGLADAWELAKSMVVLPENGGISNGDLVNMFGTFSLDKIFRAFTVEEALAKIEAYEKEKKIKVGDVVEHNGFKGVVVHILPDGELNIVYENGLFGASCSEREYAKTGKHLEIADLLRQIGE